MIFLVAAAVISFGFWFALALSGDDVASMESPLLLSVARQLRHGPWELYGPFGARNPLVLIHAPFYYRLAALAAWPLAAAGGEPITSACFVGRGLSVMSLIVTAAVAYRLARLDGAGRRAGWWAALLLVASPVVGGTGFSVRPDMLGVALQTSGVLLVLARLQNVRGPLSLALAFALFGLAIYTKQHLVIGPIISLGLLLAASWRGKVVFRDLVLGPAIATVIVVSAYLAEQKVTGGMMVKAVIVAASHVSRVHPGGWLHALTVLAAIAGNSAGLIALVGAAAVAAFARRVALAGEVRLPARIFLCVAAILVAVLACLAILQLVVVRLWLSWVLLAVAGTILLIVLPAAATAARLASRSARLDGMLAIYLAGEIVLLIELGLRSDGAWVNYAIQAMVFAAVLAARGLNRALEESPRSLAAVLTALAAVAVPATVCMDLKAEATQRRGERAAVAQLLQTLGGSPSEYFFAERPAFNRMVGHSELVYDDWLYPVFESSGLAANRSDWLARALIRGGIKFVVTTAGDPPIAGMQAMKPTRSYRLAGQSGPFRAFEIVTPPIPPG